MKHTITLLLAILTWSADGQSVIWSEDFANGIPSTWSNSGTANGVADPDAVWEYRGPNTTPNNTVGSRGAYTFNYFTPNTTNPIESPTASNGFVLFDSDFLDNAGVFGNFGNGLAAAPHEVFLETDIIDLSSYSGIEFQFTQYYKKGIASLPETFVDFSVDGGNTWGYTEIINSWFDVDDVTDMDDRVIIDCDSYLSGQDSVVVRFRFNGIGYVWMLDDIQFSHIPENRLTYTREKGRDQVDIQFQTFSNSNAPKTGHITLNQARPIAFDANVWNSGMEDQHNLQLSVDIYRQNVLQHTALSAIDSLLAVNDTSTFVQLNTYASGWTPVNAGIHKIVYKVLSDSAIVMTDTVNLNVSDSIMSTDFGRLDNFFGMNTNIGFVYEGPQIAVRHDFEQGNDALSNVRIFLSSYTDTMCDVEVHVYDSAAWDHASGGFDLANLLAYSGPYSVTSADTAQGFIDVSFLDPGTGMPASLIASSVFINVKVLAPAGWGFIGFRNDATWRAEPHTTYAFIPALGNWYESSDFSRRTIDGPWIHGTYCQVADPNCWVSIEEQFMEGIRLMPNPASDYVQLDFNNASGVYEVVLIDIKGQVVKQEEVLASADVPLYIGDLTPGMYIVQIQKEDFVKAIKLAVE